ncbi:MAG: hypothetical protein NVS2B8_19130 [Vulcanimicrobiaceae bacterium]
MRVREPAIVRLGDVGDFALYDAPHATSRVVRDACVVDTRGVVRLALRRATVSIATVGVLSRALATALDAATAFGDVGRALPEIHLVYAMRLADLGTLAESEHVFALAAEEVRGLAAETRVAIVAAARDA